jgi:hypothetical protein
MTGVGARHELDLQADGFGHNGTLIVLEIVLEFARKLATAPQMSRNQL